MKGLTTDLEKTELLDDFVAQNFRRPSLSLGLARYQPQPAAETLPNQYGDCKDKNTLLAALLEAEGLHSSSVLINSFRKSLSALPSQFNHAITMLPLAKDEVWLDATTEVAPFRLLAHSLRKQQTCPLICPAASPTSKKLGPILPCPTDNWQKSKEKLTTAAGCGRNREFHPGGRPRTGATHPVSTHRSGLVAKTRRGEKQGAGLAR